MKRVFSFNTLLLLVLSSILFYSTRSFSQTNRDVFSYLNANSSAINKKNRVIIQFKNKPLTAYQRKNESFRQEHQAFKKALNAISIKSANECNPGNTHGTVNILHEYFTLFNGIALECPENILKSLKALPMVEEIYKDRIMKVSQDISFSNHLTRRTRKQSLFTGKGVRIGLIDTGVDYNNPALGGGIGPDFRIKAGYDFIGNGNDPIDRHSHGTKTACIIGSNSEEAKGVAPEVDFIIAKSFNRDGEGYLSDIIEGIIYCFDPDDDPSTDDGVDIINMSFGGTASSSDPLVKIVENLTESGILCVVSTGGCKNTTGKNNPIFSNIQSPGIAPNALTVGAAATDRGPADFAVEGPDMIFKQLKPEIIAPATNIKTYANDNMVGSYSDVSFGAPHIVGTAALIIEKEPDLSPKEIKALIINSAVLPDDDTFSPYYAGNGYVETSQVLDQKIIVKPAVLNFGLVEKNNEDWSKSIEITIKNISDSSQVFKNFITENLPQGVQFSFHENEVALEPGEETTISAELTVSSSVPILDQPPYSYTGQVLLDINSHAIRLPISFFKTNTLTMTIECEFAPQELFIVNSDSSSDFYKSLEDLFPLSSNKYTVNLKKGEYHLYVRMSEIKYDTDTSYQNYLIFKENVTIDDNKTIIFNHNEADHQIYYEDFYDEKNEKLDLYDSYTASIRVDFSKFHDTYPFILTDHFFLINKANNWAPKIIKTYISNVTSSAEIQSAIAWRKNNNLIFLFSENDQVASEQDIYFISGAENLSSFNFKVDSKLTGDINDINRLEVIKKSHELEAQGFNNLLGTGISILNIDCDSTYKITTQKLQEIHEVEKNITYYQMNFTESGYEAAKTYSHYVSNMLRIDSSDYLNSYDHSETNGLFLQNTFGSNDTIKINIDKHVPLPTFFGLFKNPNGAYSIHSRNICLAKSPFIADYYSYTGSMDKQEKIISKKFYNYKAYDGNDLLLPSDDNEYELNGNFSYFHGQSSPYDILGQKGIASVDLTLNMNEPEKMEFSESINLQDSEGYSCPSLDNFLITSNGKYTRWITPDKENSIDILLFDFMEDMEKLEVSLKFPNGDLLPLEPRAPISSAKYSTSIPDNLNEGFVDVIMKAEDAKGNTTVFRASPAFFYGHSIDSLSFNSRIKMNCYHLNNHDDFPFSAGDTLQFSLDFYNYGNEAAENVSLSLPETDIFKPVESELEIGVLTLEDTLTVEIALKLLRIPAHEGYEEYRPKITWNTKSKEYSNDISIKIIPSDKTTSINTHANHPKKYLLFDSYPNPFTHETNIPFQTPVFDEIQLEIYDLTGRKIATLFKGKIGAGRHELLWKGDNHQGSSVASGIYFIRMTAPGYLSTKKILKIK